MRQAFFLFGLSQACLSEERKEKMTGDSTKEKHKTVLSTARRALRKFNPNAVIKKAKFNNQGIVELFMFDEFDLN
ncbi:MAG: hypothetical protein HYZ14_07050 [Bacteroidetes bacterium]|nr:hypothetical protein [Bacteroidota bacterium]